MWLAWLGLRGGSLSLSWRRVSRRTSLEASGKHRHQRTRSVPPGRRQGQREELRSSSCIAARATSTRFSPSSTTSTRKGSISDSCPWGPWSRCRKVATGTSSSEWPPRSRRPSYRRSRLSPPGSTTRSPNTGSTRAGPCSAVSRKAPPWLTPSGLQPGVRGRPESSPSPVTSRGSRDSSSISRAAPGYRSQSRTGAYDPNVSVDFGREARGRLETAGLAVRYHEDPVGHTITPGGIAQARIVLAEALA